MYSAVLRSEECMEKIVCELGGMAKDITPMTGLVEPFVPAKYTNYYKQFKSGKDCHKIKCGTAKRLKCTSDDNDPFGSTDFKRSDLEH
jgi:hypothetical protein